jgi:hypothetical protein
MSDQALAPLAAPQGRPPRREPLLDRVFLIFMAFGTDYRSLTVLSLRAGRYAAALHPAVVAIVRANSRAVTGIGVPGTPGAEV